MRIGLGIGIGICAAIGVAVVSAGEPSSATEAIKLDVQSGAKTTTAGSTVTSDVLLKNTAGATASAGRAIDVNVEMVGSSGKTQSQTVHFDRGQTRATVKWQVNDPGIAHVRAFDPQKGLLDDSDAIYVKPKPAAQQVAPPNESGASVGVPRKAPQKHKAPRPVRRHPPGADADVTPSRFAVLLASTLSPLTYVLAQETSQAPREGGELDGGLLLDVSARELLGMIANGSDAATVSVFYTGTGPALHDIHVWLHWECGELSGQPVIPKGGDHAEVRWTSRGPCEGTLQLLGSSPHLPFKGSKESKVRFVRDVDLQVNPIATFSPLDQPQVVANLVDHSTGEVIAAEVVRTVTFASTSPTLDVAPGAVPIAVGASQAVTVLTPRAFFDRALIQLATPGVSPKPLPVQLSSLWLILATTIFALLGSVIRYLQQRRAPLETFLVGFGAAVVFVALYLLGVVRNFQSPIVHSILAVPIVALAAGYLGQTALDSGLQLAGLRSPPDKGGRGSPPAGAAAASG